MRDRPRTKVPAVLATLLEAFAQGDLGAAARTFGERGAYHEAHKEPIRGRAAIAAHFTRFAESGAAWEFVVEDVLVDGDRACVVFRYAHAGGAAQGRLERDGCALVSFDGRGQIAQWREYDA